MKPAKKNTQKPSTAGEKSKIWTDEERAAMQEHAQMMKTGGLEGEGLVLEKISKMKEPDRAMAKRLHTIIKATAPILTPRLWYGMPAYANRDGKIVCFFQDAQKFKTRYATFGFSDKANLDEGNMWPNSFALKELTPSEETRISMLVKKAIS